jgi:hypothetical protein
MRLLPVALGLAVLAASRAAIAQSPGPAPAPVAPAPVTASAPDPIPAPVAAPAPAPAPREGTSAAELNKLRDPPGPTYHGLGAISFGDGFRFNNPYRLQTQLGESAKTVSVTAPYVHMRFGLVIGDAFGLQHGGALDLTVAMSGIGQAVLAPTYTVTYRGTSHRFLALGRLGPAIVLSPDPNVGGELGVGGAVFVTASTAVTAEVIGNLFYGAATTETGFPVYPVLSFQLGLLFDHEVLP